MLFSTLFVVFLNLLNLAVASPYMVKHHSTSHGNGTRPHGNSTRPHGNSTKPALHLLKRQNAPAVIEGILDIGKTFVALNETMSKFGEHDTFLSTAQNFELHARSIRVHTAYKTASIYVRNAPKFNGDESHDVLAAIRDLTPKVEAYLNNYIQHRQVLGTVLFRNDFGDQQYTVEHDLNMQKFLSLAFANTVKKKLAKPYDEGLLMIMAPIHGYYDSAILKYARNKSKA